MKEAILGIILGTHKVWLESYDRKDFCADLSNADLSNADLSNADLSYANLYNANLSNANLSNANLSNANLYNANLYNANLYNANLRYIFCGNNREVFTLQLGIWQTVIGKDVIAIGCQQHKPEEWFNFDDNTIAKMDAAALEWWNKNKQIIKQVWENNFSNKG